MLFHHSIPLMIYFIVLVLGYTFRPFYLKILAVQLLNEIPTVPLNICWILDKCDNTKNMIFAIFGWITLVTYFIFRLILNPCICVFLAYEGLYGINILLSPLIILNIYWFKKLLKKCNGETVDKNS